MRYSLLLFLLSLMAPAAGAAMDALPPLNAPGLRASIAGGAGALAGLRSGRVSWLVGPVRLEVKNEATGKSAQPGPATVAGGAGSVAVTRKLDSLALSVKEQWAVEPGRLAWDLSFEGVGERAGHEVTLDFPILSPARQVFTPGEHGVVSVAARPDFRPAAYGAMGWGSGESYVLPLVSVLDPKADAGLTIALPPDRNIPALQVEWIGGKTLRLRLAHRGMGGGKASPLRLLFYAHAADYRSALKAYSDDFPAWFRPGLPRGPYEGAFWYHHIQDHPDFAEMARQDVRYLWASFWFTHLGEYLPDETEWKPYTYARWWKLGQTMSDEKIRAFVREMHGHGIGTFAYFNVTEFGGAGGGTGDAAAANRILREKFADALVRDANGQAIPTWEGALAMNAGRRYSLFPALQEQVRRHVARLPELDGFCIDRLDWASRFDYGHSDGLSMVGKREVENMAGPVGEGVAEVCRQAHAAGMRVYVNQFYRVEMLRDVDGVCHENDTVRGIGYLCPFRPASAWNMRKPYAGDLLQHEAQLKLRLQFALFPQMIAHEFPISQQAANAGAADMLEVYAPLFSALRGKEQVLLPHCVSVTGANDANLFRDQAGHSERAARSLYVAPVTSRLRFLARGGSAGEPETLSLRVPDAAGIRWAYVLSADGLPYRADVRHAAGAVHIALARHATASVVLAGKGAAPALPDTANSAAARRRLFPPRLSTPLPPAVLPSALPRATGYLLKLTGVSAGPAGPVAVSVGGRKVGELQDGPARFDLGARRPDLEVTLSAGDEGTWYVVERAELLARTPEGQILRVARWVPSTGAAFGTAQQPRLRLSWCRPEVIPDAKARFAGRDTKTAGAWKGKLGARAAWIADVPAAPEQGGCRLSVAEGQPFTWAPTTEDPRAPALPGGAGRRASCWFAGDRVALSVTPADAKPYRLTLYLLDYDRNGRAETVRLLGEMGPLDTQAVATEETAAGVHLAWEVTGPVTVEVTKTAGFNTVLSGVFVDP